MEKSLNALNLIDKSRLKKDDYFKSLVNEAANNNILTEFHIEKIQTGLIELLNDVCLKMSEKGNSSLREEAAQEIADSIMYTLSVILKTSPTPESACERLKGERIEDLFFEGQQEIISLITRARGKWAVISKSLFETENIFYNLAIKENSKEFFQKYNYEKEAFETVSDFEYPLCADLSGITGIEYVYWYLTAFKIENDFLKKFPKENVHFLMCLLDDDFKKLGFVYEKAAYKNIPVNIFMYVFSCALALVYLKKDPFSLCLEKEDGEKINALFSEKDYTETVQLLDGLCGSLSYEIEASEEMRDYLRKAVRLLAFEISKGRKNALTSIFPVKKAEDEAFSFEAKEEKRLDDIEYRYLIAALEKCENRKKIIEAVKENFKNADDFSDAVKDLKLTKTEVLHCLDFLDKSQGLRLYKRYNIFSYLLSNEDKFMKEVLEIYVSSMDKKEKNLVLKLVSLMN